MGLADGLKQMVASDDEYKNLLEKVQEFSPKALRLIARKIFREKLSSVTKSVREGDFCAQDGSRFISAYISYEFDGEYKRRYSIELQSVVWGGEGIALDKQLRKYAEAHKRSFPNVKTSGFHTFFSFPSQDIIYPILKEIGNKRWYSSKRTYQIQLSENARIFSEDLMLRMKEAGFVDLKIVCKCDWKDYYFNSPDEIVTFESKKEKDKMNVGTFSLTGRIYF